MIIKREQTCKILIWYVLVVETTTMQPKTTIQNLSLSILSKRGKLHFLTVLATTYEIT